MDLVSRPRRRALPCSIICSHQVPPAKFCVAQKGDLEGSESLSSHVFAANSATASDGFADLEERVKTVVEDLIEVSIELDSDLNESGHDSLATAELSTKLSAALQVKLFPTLLSTAPTLRELQQCVRKETTALGHKPMAHGYHQRGSACNYFKYFQHQTSNSCSWSWCRRNHICTSIGTCRRACHCNGEVKRAWW